MTTPNALSLASAVLRSAQPHRTIFCVVCGSPRIVTQHAATCSSRCRSTLRRQRAKARQAAQNCDALKAG